MAWSVLVAAGIVVVLAWFGMNRKADPREPPYVRDSIPLLGSVYGLFRHGMRYFDRISAQQPHPIFTIELLGQKNYIVTSPELVQAVQRNVTDLSFSPAMVPAFRRMMGFSNAGIDLIFRDAHSEQGMYGEIHHIQKSSLLPGTSSLDELCVSVRARLMDDLNAISAPSPLKLYSWLQDLFMRSNNSVVFGPQDPFTKDPLLNDVFWIWEANIKTLLLGIPWLLSPKSYASAQRSRATLVAAFTDYLTTNNGISGACSFIKDLSNLGIRRGLSTEDNARALLGSILAMVGNTIPTTFWLLIHIYSRPDLLAAIRAELQQICRPQDIDATANEHKSGGLLVLNVTDIRSHCPLLVSTWDETLRLTSGIATMRYTHDDAYIGTASGHRQWLLKKGATVQMPTAFIHTDRNTWGDNARKFDPTRFLRHNNPTLKELDHAKNKASDTGEGDECQAVSPGLRQASQKIPSRDQKSKQTLAFRPFGGGNTLCPGRHLASYQILSFVGTMVMGFDVVPVNEKMVSTAVSGHWGKTEQMTETEESGGGWHLPEMDRSKLPLTSLKPLGDVEVVVTKKMDGMCFR